MREEQYHARGMFHEVRSPLPNPLPARTLRSAHGGPASCSRLCHARRGSAELVRLQARPPSGGEAVTVPAVVPKLSGTPGGTRWAGPELGEHTDAVLREELGMSDAELARLRSAGAI
jgi:crotonobetainyl-CoA:carnitine CoA-transferase CaiB-like acyl-CoA transferase